MRAQWFLQRFQGGPAPAADLETTLAAAVESARAANPGVELDERAFVEHLADRLLAPHEIGTLRAADLWLACAATRGDRIAAIRVSELIGDVRPALARFRRDGAFEDDVLQRVRERVLTGASPRIGTYGGRGDLVRFLRAIALRIALDLTRGEKREVSDDEALEERAIPADDPELALMRAHYASEFRAAMREALAGLDAAARTALRMYYVDGLNLEELASFHQVVPSTVWRRLAASRASVLETTRRILRDRLGLGDEELQSVLRLIESRLELPNSVFENDAG